MEATPVCPLLSAGREMGLVCLQGDCAWFVNNYKTCSIYLMAHNAALDIRAKQNQAKQQTQQ